MAVNILSALAAEVERQIGQPLLEHLNVHDVALPAVEHLANVFENLGIRVLKIFVVKAAQVLQRVEFQHLIRVVAADIHRQPVQIALIQPLPQVVFRLRLVILLQQHLPERLRKRAGEVHVTQHAPHVLRLVLDANDLALAVADQAVLIAFSRKIHSGIISLIHILLKDVVHEIVVRRTDVGVFQLVHDPDQRRGVVVPVIVLVHHNLDAKLLLEIEKLLLHVAHDHRNVRDPGLVELPDLALNQDLSLYEHQPFWLFIRQRRKAGRHARRHDDRVFHLVRRKRLLAGLRQPSVFYVSLRRHVSDAAVHLSQGNPGRTLQFPLGSPFVLLERGQHSKFILIHTDPPSVHTETFTRSELYIVRERSSMPFCRFSLFL